MESINILINDSLNDIIKKSNIIVSLIIMTIIIYFLIINSNALKGMI